MLKSYLRFLSRNKLYTAIEAVGLSISMAFVILIACHAWQQIRINRENDIAKQIYTVGMPGCIGLTYGTAEAFSSDIPDIESYARYMTDETYASINDKKIKVNIASVDPSFFEMFPYYEILNGSVSDLNARTNAFVSSKFAKKLASNEKDIIGQSIVIYKQQLTIAGIVEDFENTLFKASDIIINAASPANYFTYNNPFDHFGNVLSFFKVKKGTVRENLHEKIDAACKKYYPTSYGESFFTNVELIRLDDLFFSESNRNNGILNFGNKEKLLLLSGIGLLILLSAVFNYINLNFALTGKRAKEMATRRLLGEDRNSIFIKYVIESIAFTALCMTAGTIVAAAITPEINQLLQSDIPVRISLTPELAITFFIIVLVTGSISGLLPALLASKYEPIDIIKGNFRIKSKMVFSKIFIIVQNAISVFLIVTTLVMETQMKHTESRPMNCNTENVFSISIPEFVSFKSLADELRALPCIKNIGMSSGVPVLGRGGQYSHTASGDEIMYRLTYMDTSAFNIFRPNITKDFGAAKLNSVWFTEKAFKAAGLTEDYYDISQTLSQNASACKTVAGIVETYPTNPSNMGEEGLGIICIRTPEELSTADIVMETSGDKEEAGKQIRETYEKWSQETFGMYIEPYMCNYVDDYIKETILRDSRNHMRLMEIFMILSVIISLMGLVAMSTYFSESSSKDIAIRKVFGGTMESETIRYAGNYMAMVTIACITGVPLAVWAAKIYLEYFSYRIEGWWWIPIIAVTVSFAVSLCAVLWQTAGASKTNPAESLKKE